MEKRKNENTTSEKEEEESDTEVEPRMYKQRKKGLKKAKGKGLRIRGTGKRFKREYPGQDPRMEQHQDPVADIEETMPEPDDEASKGKYPPPKKEREFRKYWKLYIDNISAREGFHISQLQILEVLCDLHVTYQQLQKHIRKHGRSYKSIGRNGVTFKHYPEVKELTTTAHQIHVYTKSLGLLPKRNKSGESDGEGDEWE